MFIYGEGSFKITKKQVNSQINGWFRPKFRAKFKLLWRGCVDRPKTPIIHGRKNYLQIRNTHCAWAKIFFHLWLYGERYFYLVTMLRIVKKLVWLRLSEILTMGLIWRKTAENTKFRPIEKSNNHKGFRDSGNVFMRFSGLHL